MKTSTITQQTLHDIEKHGYSEISTYFDAQYQLHWCYMDPKYRPCFNNQLVAELNHLYNSLDPSISQEKSKKQVRYQVLASKKSGIFNLGGDLELFRQLIIDKNKETLTEYAYTCIETIFAKMALYKKGITHITLVQGDALGGGMEAALATNVLIAERSAKMGLPEVLFNLFPGMGAYSVLSRKIGAAKAKQMILSGKLYTAEELYDLGVVDILAEDGQGEMSVYEYINKENASYNSFRALRDVEDCINPITLEELLSITDIWVDSALQLTTRDLRMMERLVNKQDHKISHAA